MTLRPDSVILNVIYMQTEPKNIMIAAPGVPISRICLVVAYFVFSHLFNHRPAFL